MRGNVLQALSGAFAALLLVPGCARENHYRDSEEYQVASRLIRELKQPNVKAYSNSRTGVVEDRILAIENVDLRMELTDEWTRTLMSVELNPIRSEEFMTFTWYSMEIIGSGVGSVMDVSGISVTKKWDVFFRTIDWVDTQIDRLNPDKLPAAESISEEKRRWRAYIELVRRREVFIEMLELFHLDAHGYTDEDMLPEIKQRFSIAIGRSARSSSEIKNRGYYSKQAEQSARELSRISLKKRFEKSGDDIYTSRGKAIPHTK